MRRDGKKPGADGEAGTDAETGTDAEAGAGQSPVDWWTLPHVLAGGALGLLLPLLWVLALLVAFEALEAVLRRIRRGGRGLFAPESGINIAADVVFGMAAAVVAQAVTGLPG